MELNELQAEVSASSISHHGSSDRHSVVLSVVVPVYNEDAVVTRVADELVQTLIQICRDWEIVFIDDGCTDDTYGCLLPFALKYPVRIVRLRRRMGQSAALRAGLAVTRGNVLITMDGDGQNDPNDIPKLLDMLQDCDLVVGNRQVRQDTLRKRLFSRCGNYVRNRLTGSQLPDSGCGLKAFRRETLERLLPVHGMHRFIPVLVEINGGRVVSVNVHHRPRIGGQSKYGIFDRLFVPFVDCLAFAWLRKRRLPNTVLSKDSGIDPAQGSDTHRTGPIMNLPCDAGRTKCDDESYHRAVANRGNVNQ